MQKVGVLTKLDIPFPVQEVLHRFNRAGYEASVVGGCVRGNLLGLSPKDWDITTSAEPEEVKLALSDLKLLEIGLKHGTVTALSGGMAVETATYRIDGTYSDSRRPDSVCFIDSLMDDLSRRGFTTNAMTYSEQNELIGCFGGQEDLRQKILRYMGDPSHRFEGDALRILRGLRFCTVLGFHPDEKTAQSMSTHRELLDSIAKERISTKLVKLLCDQNAAQILREFPLVIRQILPEVLPVIGFEQHNPHHIYDVWERTLYVSDATPADPVLRLAILLHDSGKPRAFTSDRKGIGHFYGHGAVSVQLAEQALYRPRLDGKTVCRISSLVRIHDTPLQPCAAWIHQWLNQMGEEDFRALLEIKRMDSLAQNPTYYDRLNQVDAVLPVLEQVLSERQYFSLKDLDVSGNDLIALGVPPELEVDALLVRLLNAVVNGRIPNGKEALLDLMRQTLHEKHCWTYHPPYF